MGTTSNLSIIGFCGPYIVKDLAGISYWLGPDRLDFKIQIWKFYRLSLFLTNVAPTFDALRTYLSLEI